MKDIIILGGGPGGYEAAIRGAQLGATVVLIEKDRIGGTCLNRGCIPTKALYRNAEILKNVKDAGHFGIDIPSYSLDVSKIQSRKNDIVDSLVAGIEHLIKLNKIEFIAGTGRLINKQTIEVTTADGTVNVEGKHIIIATGSEPSLPPIDGVTLPGIYGSNEILNFNNIPEKLIIIGAGVVGVEFANIFNTFGSEVTLMLRGDLIIKTEDKEISKRLASYFKKSGIKIVNKIKYKSITSSDDIYTVTVEGKKGEVEYTADKILVAAGRKPNIENIGLDELNIDYTKKGIVVDETYKTNIDNIYAIGDVNGILMLAHVASHQGIAVIEKIMGKEPTINQKLVPNCIFTFPEVSSIGESEESLKEKGLDYKTNKFNFMANGKALALGEGDGFVKVIEANDKLVGVHILGPHASDLIHEAAIILGQNLTVRDVANTIHAHPTLAEAFVEAVLGLHNEAIHQAPK
jgi:dihydrolipoamide dehydrogenase